MTDVASPHVAHERDPVFLLAHHVIMIHHRREPQVHRLHVLLELQKSLARLVQRVEVLAL